MCLGHVLQLRAIEKDLTEMHVPENLVKDIVHVVRYGGLGAALSYVSRDPGSLTERAVLRSRRHELVQAAIQTRPRFPALAGLQVSFRASRV